MEGAYFQQYVPKLSRCFDNVGRDSRQPGAAAEREAEKKRKAKEKARDPSLHSMRSFLRGSDPHSARGEASFDSLADSFRSSGSSRSLGDAGGDATARDDFALQRAVTMRLTVPPPPAWTQTEQTATASFKPASGSRVGMNSCPT